MFTQSSMGARTLNLGDTVFLYTGTMFPLKSEQKMPLDRFNKYIQFSRDKQYR